MIRLVIGHLNINSLHNKAESLKLIVKNSAPYRMDRNTNGGGIALYVRVDIPSRQILLKRMIKIQNTFLLKSTCARKKVANFIFI